MNFSKIFEDSKVNPPGLITRQSESSSCHSGESCKMVASETMLHRKMVASETMLQTFGCKCNYVGRMIYRIMAFRVCSAKRAKMTPPIRFMLPPVRFMLPGG